MLELLSDWLFPIFMLVIVGVLPLSILLLFIFCIYGKVKKKNWFRKTLKITIGIFVLWLLMVTVFLIMMMQMMDNERDRGWAVNISDTSDPVD